MKKSLLAASAIAALGGLGFAGSAHAVWATDTPANAAATKLSAESNTGVGHVLVTPYFSTGDNNATLLSVVNTDTAKGKAVKVRFRGAANSDDILDFTVLLSPGDVWSASVTQGADGVSNLVTPDTSCVLPSIPSVDSGGIDFMTTRLDQKLSAEGKAAHTREGYVEWLNMADIESGGAAVPNTYTSLFDAIKHRNNVAPCDADVMEWLMDPRINLTKAQAADFGLVPPSGKLMGNWTIVNTQNVTSYGGAASAIVALNDENHSADGRLFFAPQIGPADPYFHPDVAWAGPSKEKSESADPLVFNNKLTLMPFDLPDLSTPYVSGSTTAAKQADALSFSFAATKVMNEWTAGVDNGVNFSTDWVFSQPTRRYHAAVDYKAVGGPAAVHSEVGNFYPTEDMIVRTSGPNGLYGSVLCIRDGALGFSIFNREEGSLKPTFKGEWSPAPTPEAMGFCGEVATLTFGTDKSEALNARLTTSQVEAKNLPNGGAGWMYVSTPGVKDNGMPVIGFAANTFNGSNGANVGNYGDAIGHRYERPAKFTDATPEEPI